MTREQIRVLALRGQYAEHGINYDKATRRLLEPPCPHSLWTVPSRMSIKAEGSQEIVGEATLQVCIECGHTKGTVTNGSLLNPSGKLPFEAHGDADIGVQARKALSAKNVPVNPL